MTISYRNAGPWGAASGSGAGGRLTSLQGDNNFYDLDSRVAQIEAAVSAGMTFDDPAMTVTAGSITFHFTDGSATEDIIVPLPVAIYNPRGEWTATTNYSYLDIVSVAGLGVYLVLEDHVSDTTFDPDAGDSDPHYLLLFQQATATSSVSEPLDVSGATRTLSIDDAGLYLRCTNASACVVTVPTNASVAFPIGTEIKFRQASTGPVSFVPATGAVTINPQRDGEPITTWRGQVLTLKKVSTNGWDLYGPDGPSTLPLEVSTTTRTISLTDQDKYLRCTHTSGCVVTVPADASVDFEDGAEVHFRQCADTPVSFDPADGSVTINVRTGRLAETAANGAVATLKKIGSGEWDLFGDLAEDASV